MYYIIKLNGRYLDQEYNKSELPIVQKELKRLRELHGKEKVHLIRLRRRSNELSI